MKFNFQKSNFINIILSLIAIIMAVSAGLLYKNFIISSFACLTCSIILLFKLNNKASSLNKRLNFLVSATLNNDFAYKFPDNGISKSEKEANIILNHIVKHFEKLATYARQNEQFMKLVIDMVEIGIIVADNKGNIKHINKAALNLLSIPVMTNICQMKNTADLSINKTEATLNNITHTIYTITDIRKSIQTAEVESWEKLTRVLTHEIMNSLTPINSMAKSLSQYSTPDELKESLEIIADSAESLTTFVKNFRKFSILPEPKFKVFYLKPFLNTTISLSKNQESATNINFELSVFPPETMVCSDESMLNLVIINIIKNAIEANPNTIGISSRICDDETIEISIYNDGVLIPDNILPQIFTPFFTTRNDGSGIGLSLSKRIISHLGGTLTLSSRPITKFIIRL